MTLFESFNQPNLLSAMPELISILSGAAAFLVVATGVLLVLLLRTRAAQHATESAHTASGQGSILVGRRGAVLATNGPARNILWPDRDANVELRVNKTILNLLDNASEQHHVVRLGTQQVIEIWISGRIADNRVRGVRGLAVRDVTEQHRGQRHLVQLAHYDSLTGLGNRRLFVDRLETEIRQAKDRGMKIALLYIDLDRFKDVNDTLGHGAGDELLKALARRFQHSLEHAVSDSDTGVGVRVYRLAGDEFAIIVSRPESIDEVEGVAKKVLVLIGEPMTVSDRTIASSGSVGIALFPEHANDVEDLVKHADSALYVAKDLGRARYMFYEPSFSSDADRSHKIAQELRTAIAEGELTLHYQPKVELQNDTVEGFEALLRWNNAELGVVGPSEFIPIAEDRGMISEIGAWCLDEACRQIRVWQKFGFTVVPISVNVSSAQFRDSDVSRIVSDALVRHNIHPSMLEIELTESLLLADDENTGMALRDLRAIGVRVALDDFGTGYSALTYLNRFPLDVVKMDRGFLRDIEDSNAAAGIASAVISMSHSLGLDVIAEGVDSPRQAELLRAMGCDQIQGFLFSPGVSSEEATRFLAAEGGARPRVEPIVTAFGSHAIVGEVDPDAIRENPLPQQGGRRRHMAVRPTDPPRILVIDGIPSTLGPSAFRLTLLGADAHLMTGLAEANLFFTEEEPVLDLVIAPPEIELDGLAELVEKIKKVAADHVPRVLIAGKEPDAERRAAVRGAGADWVLWEPYSDPALRFFVNAARSNRNWKFQRQRIRVPIEAIAWIRAGGQRGSGVVTSLARRGAFIETTDTFEAGLPIRIEFKLESSFVSISAKITRTEPGKPGEPGSPPAGIDVIFYEVAAAADAMISECVERIWMRYRP